MAPEGEIRDHPDYYNWHPAGIECWDVAEPFGFNLGNAIKYIWRAGRKADSKGDLEKAIHYLQRELKRLGAARDPQCWPIGWA